MTSSSPLVKKDTSAKPAWGNAKPLPVTSDSTARSDFPTAAEVAQGQLLTSCQVRRHKDAHLSSTGRIIKPEEPKPEDPHRVPPQEADAFRGVHLDPNAHHWDEVRHHLSGGTLI